MFSVDRVCVCACVYNKVKAAHVVESQGKRGNIYCIDTDNSHMVGALGKFFAKILRTFLSNVCHAVKGD